MDFWKIVMRYLFALLLCFIVGKNFAKEKAILSLATFHEHSGLSDEDFNVSKERINKSWDEVIRYFYLEADEKKEYHNQTLFLIAQLEILRRLNEDSISVWEEYTKCGNANLTELKYRYISGERLCHDRKARKALEANMERLKSNLKNWAQTTLVGENEQHNWQLFGYYQKDKEFHMPLFHPFMGQVMVEMFASFKRQVRKYLGYEFFHTGSDLDMISFPTFCDERLEEKKKRSCIKALNLRHGIRMAQSVLTSSTSYCQNFGIYPNSSIYLFLGSGLNGLYTSHPYARLQKDRQTEPELVYLNDEDGEYYYFIFYYRDKDPEIRLGAWSPQNKERRESYIKIHAEENGYIGERKTKFLSCWSDANKVIEKIESVDDFSAGQNFVPFINEFIDFYAKKSE